MNNSPTSLGTVLVAGLGKSGLATCRYLLKRPELFDTLLIVDSSEAPARLEELGALPASVDCIFGIEALSENISCDVAVVSPGLIPSTALYKSIERASGRVISEIEFAFERCPRNWIAITGTNGKTTTTSLATYILREAGLPAVSVGNIGAPAIEAVDEAQEDTIFVAEVSSFQLHAVELFKPRVAALLNVTPDHINWHGSLEAYGKDKTNVFAQCDAGDTILLNADDEGSNPYRACAHETGAEVIEIALADNQILTWTTPDKMNIKGPHNVSNALFAALAARAFDVDDATITRALETFMPVEHRLQFVAEIEGVSWFNDSKATNPDAVFKALDAFDRQGVILLVGGRNKGNRFIDLAHAALSKQNFKYALCFGEAGSLIFDDFSQVEQEMATGTTSDASCVIKCATMDEAMQRARILATAGDCVVLSPACASFDEFDSYEQRGDIFMGTVACYKQRQVL